MRPRQAAFLAAGIPATLLLLTTAAAATSLPPSCRPILAEVRTAVVDPVTEVGEVAGLLNGAIYIRVDTTKGKPAYSKPNVVLTTKTGVIQLWMEITNLEEPEGVITRSMRTLSVRGTGEFATTRVDFSIEGWYRVKEGGTYDLAGTICPLLGPKSR